LVHSYLLNQIIPTLRRSFPPGLVPEKENGKMDVIAMLKIALPYFDSRLMQLARIGSFKLSEIAHKGQQVPQEAVYQSELQTVLQSWLVGWTLIPQASIPGLESNPTTINSVKLTNRSRCDLVLSNASDLINGERIVFELGATLSRKEVAEHCKRVVAYGSMLKATSVYVIHFTAFNDTEYEYYEQLTAQQDSITANLIHIWHDREFKKAQLTYWQNGLKKIEEIDLQRKKSPSITSTN